MEGTLSGKKQQAVRVMLHHAAMELFTKNGFDSTTVEEIAEAAGVSKRSFSDISKPKLIFWPKAS